MSIEAVTTIPLSELMRMRRHELGLTQDDVAQAVVADSSWPTVTNSEIARWERGTRIPRAEARRALEHALGLPRNSLDHAAAAQRNIRKGKDHDLERLSLDSTHHVRGIQAALQRMGSLLPLDPSSQDIDSLRHNPASLRSDLSSLMGAYQASNYQKVLSSVAGVISDGYVAKTIWEGTQQKVASEVLALSCQAAAMVLTKQGHTDLAWLAAERGLAAAKESENAAVEGSLMRSLVHTLHSQKQTDASVRLAETTAERLKADLELSSPESVSIYGTFLLTSAMASARAGDRSTTVEYLDEADSYASKLPAEANYLWTSFGKTNVDLHRVSALVALDDLSGAAVAASVVSPKGLPAERQVRYLFDRSIIALKNKETEAAIGHMLGAYRQAPEQVSHHLIGQQIVRLLRYSNEGLKSRELCDVANRMAIKA